MIKLQNKYIDVSQKSSLMSYTDPIILPGIVEDEIRQWNRPLKTCHNRRHEDGELEIEVC